MNKVSGIKISHKITSLMIGLIVGFLLMGVAYYAQISIEIRQAKTEQLFTQSTQTLEQLISAHSDVRSRLGSLIQTGDAEAFRALQESVTHTKNTLDTLANIDYRFYSANANDAVVSATHQYLEAIEKSVPATLSATLVDEARTDGETHDAAVTAIGNQLKTSLQGYDNLLNHLWQAELQYVEYLRTENAIHGNQFNSIMTQLSARIESLDASDRERQRIANLVNNYTNAFNDMMVRRTSSGERQALLHDASLALIATAADYRNIMSQSLTRRIETGHGEREVAQWMFAVVLFLTAIGTTLGLFLIYRSIVLPLWHMQSIIAQQNRGNEKARVTISANDELGNLGRAFNRLLDERIQVLSQKSLENEQLNNSIISLIRALGLIARKDLSIKVPVSADVTGTVSDAVNLLTSETARTLHQVRNFSEKINAISDQLQSQSEVVMAVAETERSQVTETMTALDQSAKTMNDIAREARVTNSIASSAIDNTLKAQESVIQTVEGIQMIRGTISETEKRIKRLGDRSQEITGIVNLINTIAERTHILALNASMHAASAGEAGKGFAVVAEEVQRLAENARNATSEISSMVNNIRVETSDTVNIMNKLITQVAEGTKLAEDSGQRMHETEAATRQLVNHVKSIAVNSVNQANIANRVRDRAFTITESTEKTHTALEEQRVQTDELKECARSLLERVNVFTLPEFRADARNTLVAIRQPAVNEEQINEQLASI